MDERTIEEIDADYDKALETWNLTSKRIFHEAFTKVLKDDNYDEFVKWVGRVGDAWNVKRTISLTKGNEDNFNRFCEHVWKNRENIQKRTYKYWEKGKNKYWEKNDPEENKAIALKKGEKTTHAHSYESKICFLIAPEKYKLINDSINRENMKTLLNEDKDYTYEEFDNNIDKCLEEMDSNYKEGTTDPEYYFKADYQLWSGNAINNK